MTWSGAVNVSKLVDIFTDYLPTLPPTSVDAVKITKKDTHKIVITCRVLVDSLEDGGP